jgi:hypothetical protein
VLRLARQLGLSEPTAEEAERTAALVAGFGATELCARLGRATQVRREQRFSFPLTGEVLMTGALDVLARERTGMLVLDYKSDHLATTAPATVVERDYSGQRLIYALAVLRSGAPHVEVAHVFLEAPDEPVVAAFTAADRPRAEAELSALADGLLHSRFAVAEQPHRALCEGCPAQGGLCSWPVAMTRRASPDQLF